VATSIILNSKMVKTFIKITKKNSFFEKKISQSYENSPPKKEKKKHTDHDSTTKTQIKSYILKQ